MIEVWLLQRLYLIRSSLFRSVFAPWLLLLLIATRLHATEPEPYLQANNAAQQHAANPVGWVASGLKTVTGPGDGNIWSGGKVVVRAFTNPIYYNLTTKKNQNLYPSALWVTTGNELPAWYRDPANGVNGSNIALKTAQLHGLPTSSLQQYNAIVEILVDPSKLIRPTRDPNIAVQPSALPTELFAAKPASMSQADYDAYKVWYTNNIVSSYGAANPDNRYPWTQMVYTYNWAGDQSSLASIRGLSEFVILGTRSGVTSALETFAVYSIQSYIYRTGADGDGSGNFHVTGPLDTLWTGTKFQPTGNSVTIASGAVVSGGEGIYLSSGGYTVLNNGSITGLTAQKYYGDGPAGTSVYFLDGGTFINGSSGIMSGDDIAIGGYATGLGVNVANYGYISGNSYAMRTGAGNDSLSVENGGTVHGSVALGAGADQISFKSGATWQSVLNRSGGTVSTLQAANISLLNGSVFQPLITGTGVMPVSSSYSLTQGAVAGTFTSVVDRYPLFDFSLSNNGGTLNLLVTRIPYVAAVAPLDPGLASIALDLYRQIGFASGDMAGIISGFDAITSPVAVADAFRQLSPVASMMLPAVSFSTDRTRMARLWGGHGLLGGESGKQSSPVRYALLPPTNDADPSMLLSKSDDWKGFVIASGHWGRQYSEGQISGFSYDAWSSQAGLEKRFSSSFLAGFSIGGSQTSVKAGDTGRSKSSIDSISPAFFAQIGADALRGEIGFGYSYNRYDTGRRIIFDGLDRTADGTHDGHQLSFLGSIGYRMELGRLFFVEPVAGAYLSGLFQGGYDESGAGAANLRINATDSWSLRSHLGPRGGLRFNTGAGDLEIMLSALWLHEFNSDKNQLAASFLGAGGGFSTTGPGFDRDTVEAATAINFSINKGMRMSAEYSIAASEKSIGSNVRLGLEWKF